MDEQGAPSRHHNQPYPNLESPNLTLIDHKSNLIGHELDANQMELEKSYTNKPQIKLLETKNPTTCRKTDHIRTKSPNLALTDQKSNLIEHESNTNQLQLDKL